MEDSSLDGRGGVFVVAAGVGAGVSVGGGVVVIAPPGVAVGAIRTAGGDGAALVEGGGMVGVWVLNLMKDKDVNKQRRGRKKNRKEKVRKKQQKYEDRNITEEGKGMEKDEMKMMFSFGSHSRVCCRR